MAIRTQGSQLYVLVPTAEGGHEVMEVECISDFSGGGNPADQIEDTCLKEKVSKKSMRGLRTPGQATFNVSADPKNTSHVKLHDMAESDDEEFESLEWALGWSDGTDIKPTAGESADFVLPGDRTWYTFTGYVADFPFDLQANTVVKTACAVQRSGRGHWVQKTTE